MAVSTHQNLMKMDSFDQLQSLDPSFKEKLLYEIKTWDEKSKSTKTKYELTFIGIKQMILEKSNKGEAVQILSKLVERRKVDDNPINDVWYAEVTLKNIKTGLETWGVSEASVFPWENHPVIDKKTGKKVFNKETNRFDTEYKQDYDTFGRTAAVAKAIRNAERQQLPEMAIQLFIEKAMEKKENVQNVNDLKETGKPLDFCKCEGGPFTNTEGICVKCQKLSKAFHDAHVTK